MKELIEIEYKKWNGFEINSGQWDGVWERILKRGTIMDKTKQICIRCKKKHNDDFAVDYCKECEKEMFLGDDDE